MIQTLYVFRQGDICWSPWRNYSDRRRERSASQISAGGIETPTIDALPIGGSRKREADCTMVEFQRKKVREEKDV